MHDNLEYVSNEHLYIMVYRISVFIHSLIQSYMISWPCKLYVRDHLNSMLIVTYPRNGRVTLLTFFQTVPV